MGVGAKPSRGTPNSGSSTKDPICGCDCFEHPFVPYQVVQCLPGLVPVNVRVESSRLRAATRLLGSFLHIPSTLYITSIKHSDIF